MICYSCEKDNWHSMGDINPERELRVCKECGTVAYKVDPEEDKKVKEYYRKQYRGMPNHSNLLTTTNKLNFQTKFLADFLKDKKSLIVGDIGCATGYLVHWFRQNGHRATGSEYTVTYRRFCEHFYGIPITEELEPKHKYDLLSLYHVLEHMTEPDKKLAYYKSLLSDDGHFLISTPEWFDILEEASGAEIQSFTYLFHKDHINVFSRQSLNNLFLKTGFEIVKEDHLTYGQTYLVKKCDPKPIVKEDWKEKVEQIKKAKLAIDLYRSGRPKEAIEIWPKFPEGYMAMLNQFHKDPERQADIFEQAKKVIPDNFRIRARLVQWFYAYQRYQDALTVLNELVEIRPTAEVFFMIGQCLEHQGRFKEAIPFFQKSADLNPSADWRLKMDMAAKCAASIPTWDEIATEKFRQHVFQQNKDKLKVEPKDPVMENVESKPLPTPQASQG